MKQKIKKKYTLLLNICEIIILLIRNLFQLQIVSKILEELSDKYDVDVYIYSLTGY